MDWKTVLQSPFFTVALPIVITLIVAIVQQNKRMDDLRVDVNRQFDGVNRQFDAVNRQLDAVNKRLDRIDSKLEVHSERIAKLEGPALVRQ